MKAGIYTHQHRRGGCKCMFQTYIKGMQSDNSTCESVLRRTYGEDCGIEHFTDFSGDCPPENVDRPGYRKMEDAIRSHEVQAIIVYDLDKISNNINLVLDFYRLCRENGVDVLTARDGKNVMKVLDVILAKGSPGGY